MPCKTDEALGSPAPVLSLALLARIRELNLDYLDLLATEYHCGDSSGQLQHLPLKLHAELAALSPVARGALAAMPYTLYSLGFERAALWRGVCESSAAVCESVGERYAPLRAPRPQGLFCEIALLHAWHVAISNRLASRVLFAMPDNIAQRLAAMPLWYIRRIAGEHPGLLMPRWPTNPGFWPDLLRFAAANDAPRLGTAKLLGSQLIAAELEQAADGKSKQQALAGRLVQSPRLRARKSQFEPHSR